MNRRLDAIKVGERARSKMGDIDTLAKSIERVGLLHPIVVNGDGELIAGARRLEAVRRLGWESVEVTVATSLDSAMAELVAERDENECRMAMAPSECVNLAERLRALEEEDARRRMADAGRKSAPGKGGSIEPPLPKDRVRDRLGGAVGMSGANYERVRGVILTAEDESEPPEVRETARAAIKEMDESGSVWGPSEKVRKAKTEAKRKRAPSKPKPRTNTSRRTHVERMSKLATTAEQIERLAPAIDMVAVLDAATDEDRERWCAALTKGIRTLSHLRRALNEGNVIA